METNLIGKLRTRKAELTESLNSAVDEKAYDLIAEELQQVTKTLTLTENREKIRVEKEKADQRRAAIQAHNAGLKRLAEMRKIASEKDKDLFSQIGDLYAAYHASYELATQIYKDNMALQQSASDLGLEIPELHPMTVLGMRSPLATEAGLFNEILKQYSQAHSELKDAHRRQEKDIPERPELDWYAKGSGQFYPRPPEPPIPPRPQV